MAETKGLCSFAISLVELITAARKRDFAPEESTFDHVRISLYESLFGQSSIPADMMWYEPFCLLFDILDDIARLDDQDRADSMLDRLDSVPECIDIISRCCEALGGKRGLFVTEAGQIGSGPSTTREKDHLVLLRGVAVPVVLRPCSIDADVFTVVGPAYVHGLMDLSEFNGTNHGRHWQAVYLV